MSQAWLSPALCLAATIAAFLFGRWLQARLGKAAWVNPTAVAIAILAPTLQGSGLPYATYFASVGLLHFLLGPATVAIGVALYEERERLRRLAFPWAVALVVGSVTGIVTALLLARLLGADAALLATVAPKSVTTPIAMGIAEQTGGEPPLTAVTVILTGLVGAILGRAALTKFGVREGAARGFAMGIASHGLGTASVLEEGQEAGSMSGLGMGLNGVLTAILVPLLLRIF